MTPNSLSMQKLPKLVNGLVKFIQCREISGKYRLFEATKHKFNRKLITYHISGSAFSIPWDQWCFWKNYGPENYYLEEIIPFTSVLNEQLGRFDFFDLGADVGVVSALVNKHCEGLNCIIALEPNPVSFGVLKMNLANINVKHRALHQAISDYSGTANFSFNGEQGSDHNGHIAQAGAGTTLVSSLDSLVNEQKLNLHTNIAIKIDVEGQELATFNGAKQVISSADKVVVFLEIHPSVLLRDGQTPEQIFAAAEKIRNFNWFVPLQGMKRIDRTKAFFTQVPERQYDVIGVSG